MKIRKTSYAGFKQGHIMKDNFSIRNAIPSDIDDIIELDHVTTNELKPDYWHSVFAHYLTDREKDRLFLVAETNGSVAGFIIVEIRAWEFGSPPCGWVFAVAVSPNYREMGIGKRMFDEISARLKKAGITTVRTMVDRNNNILLSYFRSFGLRTGSYIELEKLLD